MPDKACLECGGPLVLKTTRDFERKKFCCRSCKSRWQGRQKDMTVLWAAITPEVNARKGRRGDLHARYVPIGSASLTPHGYVKIKTADRTWEYEHRLVAAVDNADVVHHIDGDRANNRPENLIRMSNSDHVRYHRALS